MPPTARSSYSQYGYLAPFALILLFGLSVLIGWWTETLVLVQPRNYDTPLPANAALCLLLLGASPLAAALKWRKTGLGFAVAAAILGWLTLSQVVFDFDFGIDDLFVNHRAIFDGAHVGRMPAVFAAVMLLAGGLQAWICHQRAQPFRPVALALVGSLTAAYGFTALLAYKSGLNSLDLWATYARVAPHSAVALAVFGAGLVLLAAHDSGYLGGSGPRWLWLPVVVGGSTVTVIFWFALRERELGYINSTTQLTINNIAALTSGETEGLVEVMSRAAGRWNRSGGTTKDDFESDAAAQMRDSPAYRSIIWVDASLRTRWFWPQKGNEDAPLLDHAGNPVRRDAVESARKSRSYAIAAPIESPLQSPTFAVYTPVQRENSFDGFLVGEFYYDKLFDVIDRRLNVASRYHLVVMVARPPQADVAHGETKVYESSGRGSDEFDARLVQTAAFSLFGQRLTFRLTPRPEFINPTRQYLPELALLSGWGVSALLGLVVNLAQAARARQARAELTSRQLLAENEERRRVEAQLKLTDERLNLALDSTQVGVYEWNVATGQAIYSPSVWTSIGYDPSTMPATTQAWLDVIHPDDLAGFRAAIAAHFAGATPFIEPEYRVRHHNGEWDWFSARAKCVAYDRDNRPLRVIGTCQNITARKRAEEALRSSQATTRKLSLVASRTDNAVIITSPDGRVEWVNESFTRLTELPLAEVTGRPLVDLLASPDEDLHAASRVARGIARQESLTTDIMHCARSGRRFYVHLELQPVKNEEGLVENFIVIETDITTRVEVEQQLRRAKTEADDASRAKSEFLASMSHEIRTPMNGVIGMTSLLLETPLNAEQRDYVSTIRTSGDALLAIINEILDFSKIESGRMEIESHPFELAQCLEEALDIFALQAAAKGIELAYSVDPAVPHWIVGDITRLRQVLVNLLNNAVKFTARGFVTVEVKLGVTGPRQPGEKLLLDFVVTDTGIGIPLDRQNLLFKPFSQVDSSTTRKYGGTGLGLAICDRLCQLMGGTIDMSSELEAGSRFRFSIQALPVEPSPTGLPKLMPGAVIVAADDHPVNRTTLENNLTSWGLVPRLAENETGAVAALAGGKVAAAIIDHKLGEASGLGVIAKIRAKFPRLPIVLFTDAAEGPRRGESTDPLIVRLPKPIKPAFLHEALRHLLSGVAATPTAAPASNAGQPKLADSIPLNVLLVEDNPVNQKVAQRFLERLGYRSDAVGNGLEAVRTLEQRDYELVFMDVQMPEMDGLVATREIRKRLPAARQPKIVALTANAMQGDRERCLAAGMDDYITKPVKLEDIELIIRQMFGKKAG
ncbi:MAG: response regulator [Opitutae bacterium]|nr:response regulator [Opitutae bacterium]